MLTYSFKVFYYFHVTSLEKGFPTTFFQVSGRVQSIFWVSLSLLALFPWTSARVSQRESFAVNFFKDKKTNILIKHISAFFSIRFIMLCYCKSSHRYGKILQQKLNIVIIALSNTWFLPWFFTKKVYDFFLKFANFLKCLRNFTNVYEFSLKLTIFY